MRVERAQENALALAPWLESHPAVAWVRYPGLPSHPQHELAERQMDGPGSVIAFELRGGVEAGRRLMNAVRLITLAVSLGGDRVADRAPRLDDPPRSPADEQLRQGITPGLVRLAVGCEDVDDLRADLEQALGVVSSG